MLLLIPISMILLALAVWGFFWAVEHAQFDALDRASLLPLDYQERDAAEPDATIQTPESDD